MKQTRKGWNSTLSPSKGLSGKGRKKKPKPPNPSGLCMCGCGGTTTIASQTHTARGWVKGEHIKYLTGHSSRVEKKVRRCEVCDSEFEVYPSELRKGPRRFCSRKCWVASEPPSPASSPEARKKISEGRRGKNNPAFKDGARIGEADIRKVFNLKAKGEDCCRNCGSRDNLNLHHVLPRSFYRAGRTELLNGIPLCVHCHLGWHRRYVTIYRDVFTAEEWAYLTGVKLTGQEVVPWLDERYPERPAEDLAWLRSASDGREAA